MYLFLDFVLWNSSHSVAMVSTLFNGKETICRGLMYNNTESCIQYITCGVPQGSVLGQLLCLNYINDIPNCLKHSKAIVFADDKTIFTSCNNMNTLYNNMNGDLANLINWFKANKLSLNIAKTNYILFPYSKYVNVGGNMKLYFGADQIIRNEC